MKVILDIASPDHCQRKADLWIPVEQLFRVHLKLDFPESMIGKLGYMRRHPRNSDRDFDPNRPRVPKRGPQKKSIPLHIEEMRHKHILSPRVLERHGDEIFSTEPTMYAVPISDLVSNLLRPSFCRHQDGRGVIYYFRDEPIEQTTYWSVCYFKGIPRGQLEFRHLRFDIGKQSVIDHETSQTLNDQGLVWSAALVPLVIHGQPLDPVEIAVTNYDLRQLLGREAIAPIQYAYQGWFSQWEKRVKRILGEHLKSQRPFATFYHSILGCDKSGNIRIRQEEGTLPDLAKRLAREGFKSAGVLDSGGSCALYDAWLGSYLNHGWYFREPRGSILLFEISNRERIPEDRPDSWIHQRLLRKT